jgi:iron complex outermembrane recepter protein
MGRASRLANSVTVLAAACIMATAQAQAPRGDGATAGQQNVAAGQQNVAAGQQNVAAGQENPAARADVSEVVVTGTRISGAAPVGSTVTSLGRADIEVSGAVTTTQLVQELPQVYNLGISEASRGQSGGSGNITYGSTINLRGIGPYTTLVLLDGHRAVPQGTSGFAVDPSIIPTLALERVEIVNDGASAIYGSDAVAGVANLILRRYFEGLEANVSYGTGADYSERQAGLIGGYRWTTGQFTAAFQHSDHSALSGLDRAFYRGNLTDRGGGDFRVVQCNPGNIVVGGVSYAIPAGGVTAANRGALAPSTTNRCDNLKAEDLVPQQRYDSGVFTFNQDIGERIALYGDGFISKREFTFRSGYAASSLNVPSSNAFFVAPPGLTPASETVNYSFANDYPAPYTDGFSRSYEGTFGVSVKLPARWEFNADYTYGFDKDESFAHYQSYAPALTAALASATPATAFDPFGGSNNSTVIGAITQGNFDAPGQSILRFYEARFDGPLFALPGGDARAAAGYEGQDFHVAQGLGVGTLSAPVLTTRFFSRKVNSTYGELLLPFLGAGNSVPFARKLAVDVAYRHDSYSDVGSTSNPKVGLEWSPLESLTLRGSYGKSFRAPTISQIYGNTNSLFVQNYSDPTCGCIRQGVARSGATLTLRPETAKTYTAGFDFEPQSLPGAKFSLTYFDITYENQVVAYLSDLTLLQRESLFAGTGLIVRNPSAALIAQQVAETNFTGLLPSPVTLFVDGRSFNLGKSVTNGLDLDARYRLSTATLGGFLFDLNGTYLTRYRTAITPAAPQLDQLNTIFNPLRLRARATLGWDRGQLSENVFVNYVAAYTNNLSQPVQRVGAYTTVDLHLAYGFGTSAGTGPGERSWSGILRDLTLSFDVRNLFNSTPPFVNIAESPNGGGGFDPTAANPIGRVWMVGLDKRF